MSSRFEKLAAVTAICVSLASSLAIAEVTPAGSGVSSLGRQSGDSAANTEAALFAQLSQKLATKLKTTAKVESIRRSPFFGLYEARVGNQMVYTDAEVTYIITGNILDGNTLENLSKKRLDELTAIKFEDLPLKDAIKLVNGTGQHKLAYFADPNCPYCKRYEQTLGELKDTTVYVFLYAILTPDSELKSRALWCASDRAEAWTSWMRNGKTPVGDTKCEAPIEPNRALGQRLNVQGTPTTVLGNGSRVSGTIPKDALLRLIGDAEKS